MDKLPALITLAFGLTVLLTIFWFYMASKSKAFLVVALGWASLQSALAYKGIFQDTNLIPPRVMLFGVLPAVIFIVVMFVTRKGKRFIDNIDLKTITNFHAIRIPVEMVLALLYYYGVMSVYITYEGTNFDLFSGLSALFIGYFAFRRGTINKKLLLGWNILCLALLLNVVIIAIFAVPSPFQKLAFDQPNIAVLYFPYSLLPTVVVPLVLFSHLIALRRLLIMYLL